MVISLVDAGFLAVFAVRLGRLAQSEPDVDDVAPLSDDEAEAVNQALAALKVKYPDAYQAVMVRYHYGVFNKQAAARQCD